MVTEALTLDTSAGNNEQSENQFFPAALSTFSAVPTLWRNFN